MTGHRLRHLGIQALRRATQLAVAGLVLMLVLLSLYSHYRAAHALPEQTQGSDVRSRALAIMDRSVGAMDNPERFLEGYRGTLWSMVVAGYDLTDPLAAAEMFAATGSIHRPMLWSILIPVLGTLLLGRVYCSWMCPASLLLELTGKLRKILGLVELPPPSVEFSRANKYLLLTVGLAMAALLGLPLFVLIYPPAALSRLAHAWVFGFSMSGALALLGLIVAVELLVSPRWWCRTMCPGGALYGLIGWPRLLRVRVRPSRCDGCRRCEPVCEMGLDPVSQSASIECDNCGVCLRHCPTKALVYGIGLPPTISRRRGKPTSSVGILPMAMALMAGCIWPQAAAGHHILGLPHYSYKDNYPQVPTLEYPATTGPYDILMTSYPGKPVPSEAASIAFYIKNRHTGRAYRQPVTLRVLQTFTFGENQSIVAPTQLRPFDNLHKCNVTFPVDGEYMVELTMQVEGRQEVIPFLVVSGNPSALRSVVLTLLAVVGGLGCLLIGVRAIKVKRMRRQRAAQLS